MSEAFLSGQNVNIFVYGPTSTGKTFTMQGQTGATAPKQKKRRASVAVAHHEDFLAMPNPEIDDDNSLKSGTSPTLKRTASVAEL